MAGSLHRLCLHLTILAGLLLPTATRVEGKASFTAYCPEKEVVAGRQFEVRFSLEGGAGTGFVAPDFTGFTVLAGPLTSKETGLVNGRATYARMEWRYVLQAKKEGVLTVQPATIRVGGQQLKTQPLPIRVVASAGPTGKGPQTAKNEDLFISGVLDKTEAYLGEQLTYQLVLYTRKTVTNPDVLDLPECDQAFLQEKKRFDTRVRYETLQGKEYAVRTLYEMAVFPQEAGSVTIDEAAIRLGVEQDGAFGALLGPVGATLYAEPVTFLAKALPEPVPPGFSGGVGQYDWVVNADQDTVQGKDALTLSISIRGNGDLRRFRAPRLEADRRLEVFDPRVREEEEYENGESWIHSATFDYAILPRESGQFELAPTLVYFDVDSNRYVAKSLPEPIRFFANPTLDSGENPPVHFDAADSSGISASRWDSVRLWFRSPWFGVLLLLLLIGVGMLFVRRFASLSEAPRNHKQEAPGSETNSRKGRRRKPDLSREKEILRRGHPAAFYDSLYRTVQDYLSDKLDIAPADWSKEAVQSRMAQRQVPETQIGSVIQVLNACEKAVYAGQPDPQAMQAIIHETERALQSLDPLI